MPLCERERDVGISYGSKDIKVDTFTLPSSSAGWTEDQKDYIPRDLGLWQSSANISEGKDYLVWQLEHGLGTQQILLDDKEEQLQYLLFQLKTSISVPHLGRIAKQLDALLFAAKEEDSSKIGINADSLQSFFAFLRLYNELKCPFISLTPDDNIYASWRDASRVFSVHFLADQNTRFVIFKPNYLHPDRKIRIAGTATIDVLKTVVSPHNVWDWISE